MIKELFAAASAWKYKNQDRVSSCFIEEIEETYWTFLVAHTIGVVRD
jgi:hypothetical protein